MKRSPCFARKWRQEVSCCSTPLHRIYSDCATKKSCARTTVSVGSLTAKHVNEVFSSLDLNNKDVHQSKVRSHTTQHNNCKPIPRDPQITFKTPNTTDSAQHLQAFIPSQAHKRQRARSGTILLPGSPGTPSYPAYIVSYTTCLQIPASNAFATSQPTQATRCKGLREEQTERRNFAALKRIERRPKDKEKSGYESELHDLFTKY